MAELFCTTLEQKVQLLNIAAKMKQEGLGDRFLLEGIQIGFIYEGIFNLFELWDEEDDPKEKSLITRDIQEEIDNFHQYPQYDRQVK